MDFKEKFEPRGNLILHGAGQSPGQFKKYWEISGNKKPVIYMEYIKFNEVKEKLPQKIQNIKDISDNLCLQLGLNLKPRNEKEKCGEISKGIYDEDILFLIDNLKDLKNPVFLRIGYECNNPSHNYDPENFKKAWIHIANLIDKNSSNIALVWCVCTAFNREIDDILKYYPGDDYVNWIANDLFGLRHFKDNTDSVTERLYEFANNHKKPMMIGECSPAKIGVEKGIQSWEEWFIPFFKWIEDHPIVKAFCYISWDWAKDWKQPEWLNGRIEENEVVKEKYFQELSKEKYLNNISISELLNKIYL
jgi:hypothetical protein